MLKIKEPLLQNLAERLIKGPKSLELLMANLDGGPEILRAQIPQDQEYADLLRRMVKSTEEGLEQVKALLLIYDVSVLGGLKIEIVESVDLG